MKLLAIAAATSLALAALAHQFPLVHFWRLDAWRETAKPAAVDPEQLADELWNQQLSHVVEQATDASELLAAWRANAATARNKYGRSVGLNRSAYVVIRGAGDVASASTRKLEVSLSGPADKPQVEITLGPIFGNAVRDAPGWTDANKFANSGHFNALATRLNHLVESKVLSAIAESIPIGARVAFVGCAELTASASPDKPLKVIPLVLTIE